MWYNIILRSIEYKVWVFLHILWSLPSILQARIKLQFWGELFKLNNNFQNNAKFNVGHGASLSKTKYEPKNSGNFYIIFGCFAQDWIGVTKPFCLLTLVDQSTPDIFHECKMKLWFQLNPFQCACDTILTERQEMKKI